MKRFPISYVLAITIFYGVMAFIIFEAFRTSAFAGLALMPPIFLILYDYATRMEYNPMHKNPNFLCADGTIGVVESNLIPLHGGKSKLVVSVKKDYCPENQWYRAGGMIGFFSHLAGKVQLDIVDDTWKFVPIVGENLGAKEGAYWYLGSLSGKPVLDFNQGLMRKLDEAFSIISLQETIYERAKQMSDSIARGSNLNMLEVQQQFGIIMRDWGQSFSQIQNKNFEGSNRDRGM